MPGQLFQQRNLNFINVKDYGAVGDGVHDDAPNIIAAIQVATGGLTDNSNTVGATIFCPPGTYLCGSTITLYSYIHLRGAGIGVTVLKLKNAVNVDLIQGYNAPTWINLGGAGNGGNSGGCTEWSIREMTLDGNKANQSSGTSYPLRMYGYHFVVRDVIMRNGYSGGWLNDWNGPSLLGPNASDEMESTVDNVKCHDNNGIGWEWGGPHDSRILNLLSYNNGSHNIHTGPNASGMLFVDCHGYLNSNNGSVDWLLEGGFSCVNCVAEGSYTANLVILAPTSTWSGGNIYGQSGNWTNAVGIQLGQQASVVLKSGAVASPIVLTNAPNVNGPNGVFLSFVVSGASGFPGSIVLANGTSVTGATIGETINVSGNGTFQSVNAYVGTPTITVNAITGYSITVNGVVNPYTGQIQQGAVSANGCNISTRIDECRGGAITFANDASNTIIANIYQTVGTAVNGTRNVNDNLWLFVNGLTPDGTIGKGGAFKLAVNASNALQVSDTTNDVVNINTNGKFVQLPNGTIFRQYSDAYATRGVEIGNGTISYQHSSTAAVVASSGTITTAGVGIARLAPTGAVTGIILQAGTRQGQMVTVVNESAAANTVTFNTTPATANVADSATEPAIAGLTARSFIWDSATSLWYRVA